jgi:DegT/DnrJ/EryC1/StrS aminotransferase family.
LTIRKSNANFWRKNLSKFSEYIELTYTEPNNFHANMLFAIKVKKNKYFKKNDLVKYLEKNGIETRPVMTGNFVMQPVTKMIKFKVSGKLDNSTDVMQNSFLIGNHQNIDSNSRKYVLEQITKFIKSRTSR